MNTFPDCGHQAASPGQCILIVEDDPILSIMLEDMLSDIGYRCIKAGRLPKAVSLAATADIDGAILDLNLAGVESYPVADELRCRGIPFVFSTGSSAMDVREDYRAWPTLQKPFTDDELQQILASVMAPHTAMAAC